MIGLEHAGRFHVPTNCLGGSERIALLTLEELRRRGLPGSQPPGPSDDTPGRIPGQYL